MKIKCCGNCKHCRLDMKALNTCGVLIDKCGVTGKNFTNRWLSGFFCKWWRAEDATCGIPTADGYKRVCGKHMAKMDGDGNG